MNIEGGWTYSQACEVITRLKKEGYDAGITTGGVWVDASEGDEAVIAIAKAYGGGSSCGKTTLQWMNLNNL